MYISNNRLKHKKQSESNDDSGYSSALQNIIRDEQ